MAIKITGRPKQRKCYLREIYNSSDIMLNPTYGETLQGGK